MKSLAIPNRQRSKNRLADPGHLLQYCLEHWCEFAGRGIDDLQDFSGRRLPLQRLGMFSLTLGKLTFEIGDPLLRIGERAVGRRAHLRTSSGPTFRADHTMIGSACS